MALLEVEDVHSYYGNIHALKGSAGSIGAQRLFLFCRYTLLQGSTIRNFVDNIKSVKTIFQQTEDILSGHNKDVKTSMFSGITT